YRAMRSNMADLLLGSGLIEKYPDREKWSLVAEHFPEHLRIPINYSCDKGWYDALACFAKAILDGSTPRNANALDGALTVAMSLAALESARTGKAVEVPIPLL
ncbi:MAG: hypothetical protein V2A58_04235, partial [Planctomycetota bacterium]